jgi:hypothetical protein
MHKPALWTAACFLLASPALSQPDPQPPDPSAAPPPQAPTAPPPGQPPPAQPGQPPAPGQYPPPYYGPPPYYPPPQYYGPPPGSQAPKKRPKTLAYREGEAPPPGYREEERASRGLTIGGSVTFGVMYFFPLYAAIASNFEDDTGWLAVPILGPVIYARQNDCDDDADVCLDGVADFFLTVDALGQLAGAIMLGAGLASRQKIWVREDASLSISPALLGKGQAPGLMAVGHF